MNRFISSDCWDADTSVVATGGSWRWHTTVLAWSGRLFSESRSTNSLPPRYSTAPIRGYTIVMAATHSASFAYISFRWGWHICFRYYHFSVRLSWDRRNKRHPAGYRLAAFSNRKALGIPKGDACRSALPLLPSVATKRTEGTQEPSPVFDGEKRQKADEDGFRVLEVDKSHRSCTSWKGHNIRMRHQGND